MRSFSSNILQTAIALAGLFLLTQCKQDQLVELDKSQSNTSQAKASPNSKNSSTDGVWLTDYAASVQKQKSEKKFLLMLFTGSDWCPPCKLMDQEVFDQKKFRDYAREHLVLLKLDFPARTPQAPGLRRQNEQLRDGYAVEAYPTVLIFSPDGKLVATLHYTYNGPGPFWQELRKVTG